MEAYNTDTNKAIRMAATIAMTGNLILAVLKITAGIIANSGALVGDGIDSSTDVMIGIVTLAVARIISKPPDAGHPWGHRRAETVATVFLSFIIFLAGTQLIIHSVSNIISGEQQAAPTFAAVVAALISIAGKAGLAWSQHILGKRAKSAMIHANAKNMTGDILVSFGVLAGLVITQATGALYADRIITILIGAWIIKTAVGIFLEANLELMDGSNDLEPYRIVIGAVNSVKGASRPHRARIRNIAGFWDIDLDIDVDSNCTLLEAHGIASQVEAEIRRTLENVYDIMIHVEPSGDNAEEVFGLSEGEMRGGQDSLPPA